LPSGLLKDRDGAKFGFQSNTLFFLNQVPANFAVLGINKNELRKKRRQNPEFF